MLFEGSLLRPKSGKISTKGHPFYLKPQKRWLAFKFEGSRHFSPVCKPTSIQTLSTFYMKHGARDVVRSRDAMTIRIDSHGYIYIYIYIYIQISMSMVLRSPAFDRKGAPLVSHF